MLQSGQVTPACIYLNGTLLFVAGLAIIRSHNHWVRHWPVMITLTGWIALVLGLFRMLAPEMQLRAAKNSTLVVAEAMLVPFLAFSSPLKLIAVRGNWYNYHGYQ